MSKILTILKQVFQYEKQDNWYNRIKGFSTDLCEKLEGLLKKQQLINLEFLQESRQTVILKAYSKKLKQNVALKVSNYIKGSLEHLKREYDIIKGIKEASSIVKIYDFIYFEKYLISVLVMEYCEMSLYEEMELYKQLNKWYSQDEITSIIIQISYALSQIHCYKIIHADIKPQNILKTKDGKYKLCDFGISKRLNSDSSNTNDISGLTFKYSSPEQYKHYENQDQLLSCKTDIFSVGLVFLELLKFPLNESTAKKIRENNYKELKSIDYLQNSGIFKILRQKLFKIDPSNRISSYELIYSLVGELQFSEKNLNQLLTIARSIKKQDTFDNSRHISFVLNLKLYYSLLEVFIFNKLSKSFISQLSYPSKDQDEDDISNNLLQQEDLNLTTNISIDKSGSQNIYHGNINNEMGNSNAKKKPPTKYHFIGDALSNCSLICEQLGKFNKAILLRGNAIKNYQKVYSYSCMDIAKQLQQLCWNYYQLKDYYKSVQYGLKSIDMFRYLLKQEKNQFIAECYRQLAWSYQQINKRYLGLESAQKALNIYIQIHGEKPHKDIAYTLNTLGYIHSGVKNYSKELEYKLQSLEMFQQLYPNSSHPSIAAQLNNVGVAYFNTNQLDKAQMYYQQSLQMKKSIYGKAHPEIISTLKNIQEIYKRLNQSQNIEQIEQEISSINIIIQKQQEDDSIIEYIRFQQIERLSFDFSEEFHQIQ
ncbi:protein kinase (macronuclear) [Tetrahymena thermophila SB210]|uniref:Protein kinase n=1 Tax=Tetrahymena thermophila (strain SB210) TaxID=312017 RepID=I7M8E5_TETTS|nr:protein kinase [Tetrahymena thermophila SB210]EAR97928.2 protein kinase [Tetrahymena thermophila SB210]|eukprot:XP_001018173.2 protein kinase [Tetrahymena thermophila SB210]